MTEKSKPMSMQFAAYSPILAPISMPTPKATKGLPNVQSPKSPIKKRNVGVPKFLRFLYEILEKEDKSIISWSHKGTAFQIRKPDALSKGILPRYFKHNKVSSFQRQLNYFGFKKWTKTQTAVCTFSHPNFVHHKPENIKLIKRKERGLSDPSESPSMSPAKQVKVRPTWNFPATLASASTTSTSTQLASQPYDFLMYETNSIPPSHLPYIEKKQQHQISHMLTNILPMQVSTQIHITSQSDSFATEWGDVLMYAPPPLDHTIEHSPDDDPDTYFDLWDDETNQAQTLVTTSAGPYTQAMHDDQVLCIKHEDMLVDGQGALDQRSFVPFCADL